MATGLLEHGFSLGRVHVLEDRMLTVNDLERLLDTSSVDEVINILSESDYGIFVNEIKNENDIEQSLDNYIDYLLKISDELGNKFFSQYFRAFYDFENIKLVMLGQNPRYSGLSNVEPILLQQMFNDEKYAEIARLFNSDEHSIKALIDNDSVTSLKRIERMFYNHRLALAKKTGLSLMSNLARKEVDLANIRSYFLNRDFVKDFLNQGNFKAADFEGDQATKNISSLCPQIKSDKEEILDKHLDDCLIEFISEAKYESTKTDRIGAFIQAKLLEIKNVRLLLFGKLNDLNKGMIEQNLRRTYA